MNPFEAHGIDHLSASSLNLARSNLSLWVVQYLFGERGQPSLAMIAGNAAEDGVTHGLFHPGVDLEVCKAIARDSFMRRTEIGRAHV